MDVGRSNECYCSYGVEEGVCSQEGLCLKHPNAACYHAIKEVRMKIERILHWQSSDNGNNSKPIPLLYSDRKGSMLREQLEKKEKTFARKKKSTGWDRTQPCLLSLFGSERVTLTHNTLPRGSWKRYYQEPTVCYMKKIGITLWIIQNNKCWKANE